MGSLEIQFEMDGAAWREARRALLFRRLLFVIGTISAGCLAMVVTTSDMWRFAGLALWPMFFVIAIIAWRRKRDHPERYPHGSYIIRASPEQLEMEYSIGHGWFSWDFVQWTRRSGWLVGWVRGSGVICIPPGSYTAEQEAQLRGFQANASGHHPSPPVHEGYDEVEVGVDDNRDLRVRGRQVFMDELRDKNRRGIRVLWVISAVALAGFSASVWVGDPVLIAEFVLIVTALGGLSSIYYWGPYLAWFRKPAGERFTINAGPKGIWVHSARGTTAIRWERITQVLHGRATTAICIGPLVTPIPDLAFDRTLDGEAFAERARKWRERAHQPTEVPHPEGVVSPDIANPFAPPA